MPCWQLVVTVALSLAALLIVIAWANLRVLASDSQLRLRQLQVESWNAKNWTTSTWSWIMKCRVWSATYAWGASRGCQLARPTSLHSTSHWQLHATMLAALHATGHTVASAWSLSSTKLLQTLRPRCCRFWHSLTNGTMALTQGAAAAGKHCGGSAGSL